MVKKKSGFVWWVFFLIVFFGIGSLFVLGNNMSIAANFADDVLRPLLGNEKTILLESYLFDVMDQANQVFYKVNPAPPLKNEGIWKPVSLPQFPDQELLQTTYIRPDPIRSYAQVLLVKMNMKELAINAVAGTLEPGKPIGNPGSGKIPVEIQKGKMLVAAFNGGFQYRDGRYGMMVGSKTYVPLRTNLGTLVIRKNGVELINYTGQDLGKDVVAVRQNGPILAENGKFVDNSPEDMRTWGLTVTKTMSTWRSGLGVTKEGDLIYAVGPSLLPETLAKALILGGAESAIQLDINPFWVRYTVFSPNGKGWYTFTSIDSHLTNGGNAYLSGYKKDFFYVFKR